MTTSHTASVRACRLSSFLWVCAALPFVSGTAFAQIAVDRPAAPAMGAELHRHLDREFQRRLPAASAAQIDAAERQFLDHLRASSTLAAQQLASGRIEEDDVASRIDVFLADHPEFNGAPAAAAGSRPQILEALRRYPDLAATDTDRQALADRFVVWIGNLSGSTRDALLAGRMSADELQSRIDVFAGDVRSERNRIVADPALAAVPAIAEAFEKANLGPVTERADSICCRGSITEGGSTRDFVMFKKRPASIRLNAVQGGLVVGVLAYDGTLAWRQTPGRAAVALAGAEAASLVASARFDDPLVGYRERGAVARLESAPGAAPLRVSIRETDGTAVTETFDATTYSELTQVRRTAEGREEETRFRDYKKIGPLNYASVQELWIDGALRSTTRLSDVRLDAGVLAKYFARPAGLRLDYMDYMGGLAALEKIARKNSAGVVLPAGAVK